MKQSFVTSSDSFSLFHVFHVCICCVYVDDCGGQRSMLSVFIVSPPYLVSVCLCVCVSVCLSQSSILVSPTVILHLPTCLFVYYLLWDWDSLCSQTLFASSSGILQPFCLANAGIKGMGCCACLHISGDTRSLTQLLLLTKELQVGLESWFND